MHSCIYVESYGFCFARSDLNPPIFRTSHTCSLQTCILFLLNSEQSLSRLPSYRTEPIIHDRLQAREGRISDLLNKMNYRTTELLPPSKHVALFLTRKSLLSEFYLVAVSCLILTVARYAAGESTA